MAAQKNQENQIKPSKMKLKNLTILLRDGLANRMRVMASVAHLAKQGVKIKVLWVMNWALNCEFEKLFMPIEGFSVENIKNEPRMFYSYEKNTIKRTVGKIYNKSKGYDFALTKGQTNIPQQLAPVFENYENVFVSLCFCLTEQENYSIFKESKQVQETLSKIDFKNYIGIHIRRGDHIWSMQKCPIKLFTDYISANIGEKEFYIATDSPDLRYLLKMHFGERILTHEFSLERDSDQGIIDALAEMIILSKSEKIIGSQLSSYDEVASKLGNVKLEKLSI